MRSIHKYKNLFQHIQNPFEYIFNKSKRSHRSLQMVTKPSPIRFEVTAALYPVFKEVFMEDVYDIERLAARLPDSGIVLDIGANGGFFDCILLSKKPGLKIHAFEPLPANVQTLEQLVQDNPSLQDRLQVKGLAVTGKKIDHIELFIESQSEHSVVASSVAHFDERNKSSIQVPTITFTEILTPLQKDDIVLLKIDCEGSEYDIFYNTPVELIQKIPFISAEVHDLDKDTMNLQYFSNILKGWGYHITHRPINGFCHALEATRK